MQNSLTVAGSLVSDIILDTDDSGARIARFRVVIHSRRKDPASGLWASVRPTVLPVTCRRRLAENVAGSLRNRDPVIVAGRLLVCEDGRRPYVEIDAWSVGPDLARTRAELIRASPAA